jgi:signal transduction histidine kinase
MLERFNHISDTLSNAKLTRAMRLRGLTVTKKVWSVVAGMLASFLLATLIGSVVGPALETRRIMQDLLAITTVIEPARRVSWRLESGLGMEYSALQGYALSGDTTQLSRYRSIANADVGYLTTLERLAPKLGADAVVDAAAVRRRVVKWQDLNRALFEGQFARADFAAAVGTQQLARDSIIAEIDKLPARLSVEAATRLEEVRQHEWSSLVVNAALVFVAIAALLGVAALTRRERRLAAILEHRLEEESALRQELERVMRSRQRLMRGFSHDVKNPLGAADGYAELLVAGIYGDVSASQRATIERIRRSIHGALSLIEDLHELARAETGNIMLRWQSVNLEELARSIGEEYRGAATASGLSLEIDVAPDPPTVETDPMRVLQIVGNLLSNAIKYTKEGSVRLRVRHDLVWPGGGDDWAEFDVVDTGPGIPADKRDVIFEEFSRLGTSDKPGAGLGLAISKRLAEALGGHISVESEVGHGSTFTLRIPVRRLEGLDPTAASSGHSNVAVDGIAKA